MLSPRAADDSGGGGKGAEGGQAAAARGADKGAEKAVGKGVIPAAHVYHAGVHHSRVGAGYRAAPRSMEPRGIVGDEALAQSVGAQLVKAPLRHYGLLGEGAVEETRQ